MDLLAQGHTELLEIYPVLKVNSSHKGDLSNWDHMPLILYWPPDLTQFLICLNNKNLESDIRGVKADRSKKQSSKSLVLTSTKTDKMIHLVSINPQTKGCL